uniref:ACB domain-containing protein n=1 Tax=Steinernema glaseri TaxID=37863 RepID=A0A1I7Y124_9BILA
METLKGELETVEARREEAARDARIKWTKWQLEQAECEHRAVEWKAYWDWRKKEDKDLWRNKGEHGEFEVPVEEKLKLNALYMQATVGDYDGNEGLECAEEWKLLKGRDRVESQREFISLANRLLTKYGWNPPPGWR